MLPASIRAEKRQGEFGARGAVVSRRLTFSPSHPATAARAALGLWLIAWAGERI